VTNHFGAEVVAQQVVDQGATLFRLDPQGAKVGQVVRLGQHAADHLAPVFVHRNGRGLPVPVDKDEVALRVDDDMWRAYFTHTRAIILIAVATTAFIAATGATAAGARWIGDEIHAEQVGDAG